MRKLLLSAVLVGTAMVPSFAFAGGLRSASDVARAQLMRLHVRLTREALAAPAIDEARRSASQAYSTLYQVRENVLIDLRKQEAYADLKLAIWHQQQQLAGLHTEVPVKVAAILSTAKDSLSLRTRLTQMEVEALEANDDFLAARDDANAKVAAYQQAVRDALESVRNNAELMALSAQVRALSTLKSGRATAQLQ